MKNMRQELLACDFRHGKRLLPKPGTLMAQHLSVQQQVILIFNNVVAAYICMFIPSVFIYWLMMYKELFIDAVKNSFYNDFFVINSMLLMVVMCLYLFKVLVSSFIYHITRIYEIAIGNVYLTITTEEVTDEDGNSEVIPIIKIADIDYIYNYDGEKLMWTDTTGTEIIKVFTNSDYDDENEGE
jgi:hypothetical protein